MSRIGIFPFLGRGHLNPIATLGRRLALEGHDVTVFHLSVARPAVRKAGLKFCCIDKGETEAPRQNQSVWPKWRTTIGVVSAQVRRVLREAPEAVSSQGIEYMLVDQLDFAAGTVAESMGIPFVSLSCTVPTILDDEIPPPYFGCGESRNAVTWMRNGAAFALARYVTVPVVAEINEYRRKHGLRPLRDINDTLSSRAIITQMFRGFDFPRHRVPPILVYAGPFQDDWEDSSIKFPWDRLNGKPLIFASLGTVRNNYPRVFRMIAEACEGVDAQLVLSLGAGNLSASDLGELAGDPIVVDYAPQRELFRRAILTINCAGLNTTFDSIRCGVPLVAIPIAEDQPGIAARIRRAGIGEVVPFERLTTRSLRRAIETVLENPSYRASTQLLRTELTENDGVQVAMRTIKSALQIS